MIKLYSPKNEIELSFLKSILGGENISYFVHNDHFGSMKIGPKIPLYNLKTVMVDENDFDRAKEIILDFIKNTQSNTKNKPSGYSWKDKLRVLLEVFLVGWIIPGKRWPKK